MGRRERERERERKRVRERERERIEARKSFKFTTKQTKKTEQNLHLSHSSSNETTRTQSLPLAQRLAQTQNSVPPTDDRYLPDTSSGAEMSKHITCIQTYRTDTFA